MREKSNFLKIAVFTTFVKNEHEISLTINVYSAFLTTEYEENLLETKTKPKKTILSLMRVQ